MLGLSETHNLRSGTVPWTDAQTIPHSDPAPQEKVDIAILGSGIMGAIIAERLSEAGYRIALLDRRPPGSGSTAASTAEIMWAMDVPMTELAQRIGEVEAARRWTRVFKAVRNFSNRIDQLEIDGRKVERPTVYLEGNLLDAAGLQAEAAMHSAHGLPSAFLDAAEAAERFAIAPRAAIVSDGGFELDPVRLCHALLDRARQRGVTITYPIDILALHPTSDGIELEASDGTRLVAGQVILATGYERAGLFLPPEFSLLSTFAMATPPGTAPLWRENAMLWEAAEPYLYVRTSRDGRVIAGGEDIKASDESTRDDLIGAKAGLIATKLETLLGKPIQVERAWAATFGASPDGLPAIGRAAHMDRVWISAGFGGNGIAFAALAAEILLSEFAGEPDPDSYAFDPYRFAGDHDDAAAEVAESSV